MTQVNGKWKDEVGAFAAPLSLPPVHEPEPVSLGLRVVVHFEGRY
jgi:hypothetical protein